MRVSTKYRLSSNSVVWSVQQLPHETVVQETARRRMSRAVVARARCAYHLVPFKDSMGETWLEQNTSHSTIAMITIADSIFKFPSSAFGYWHGFRAQHMSYMSPADKDDHEWIPGVHLEIT